MVNGIKGMRDRRLPPLGGAPVATPMMPHTATRALRPKVADERRHLCTERVVGEPSRCEFATLAHRAGALRVEEQADDGVGNRSMVSRIDQDAAATVFNRLLGAATRARPRPADPLPLPR